MKVLDRTLDVTGTLDGERVGMTIDQSALSHIMSVLTDLYSDPELAVIREYSTNGLDSQIEAGVVRPIEVTLPSALSPYFKVRDFGLGMDAEDIRDTYSRYGTSTKRESNDVVGMLGLGCKSALTYTDQFTLIGVKHGLMTQVSIGRDEDGGGSMTIVAQDEPTDEPNGVEVIVPAKRGSDFSRKAYEFFSVWEPGSVLVNGVAPKRIDGTWITDTLLTTTQAKADYIVMGNVPYPMPPFEHRQDWMGKTTGYYNDNRQYLVAFVPIGAVQFTPSREALQMTRLTKNTVEAVLTEAREKVRDAMFAKIAAAKTAHEAQNLTREAQQMGIKDAPLWRGREVKLNLDRTLKYNDDPNGFLTAPTTHGYGRRKTGEITSTVPLDGHSIVLHNYVSTTMTPTKREKIELFMRQKGLDPTLYSRFVCNHKITKDERFWLTGSPIYDFEKEIAPIKLPKTLSAGGTAGPRGAYKGFRDDSWHNPIMAETIDTSKPVVYHEGNRYDAQDSLEWRKDLLPKDGVIVCLPANRVAKFLRDFPMAVEAAAYGRAKVEAVVKGLSKDDREAAMFQMCGGHQQDLRLMDETRVDDPALKKLIILSKRPVAGIISNLQAWSYWVPRTEQPQPYRKYPLMEHMSATLKGSILDHCYTYLNAAYAAGRS